MAKHSFKLSTFLSGLFMLLIALAFLAVGVLFVMDVIPSFTNGEGLEQLGLLFAGVILMPFVILILILTIVMFVCYLVLGIMLIVSSFKTDEAFHRWRGFVIFTIVIDFIMFLPLLLIGLGLENIIAKVVCIATSIAVVLSAILKIVDLAVSGKRLRKAQQQRAAQVETQPSTVDFSKLSDDGKAQDESEIDKLIDLKKNGLITEEEFVKRIEELKGEEK